MPTGLYVRTPEMREKMRKARLGQIPWNKGLKNDPRCKGGFYMGHEDYFWINASDEQKKARSIKISQSLTGRKLSDEHRLKSIEVLRGRKVPRGENHYAWNPDRDTVRRNERNHQGIEYKNWRMAVKIRDGWKCRINDNDCVGCVIAHHILDWVEYPELRYQINNGITLCQAHHPLKRAEEKRLVSVFQELTLVSKERFCL